jgi:transcriptional regulator with XRE-family HTH domain
MTKPLQLTETVSNQGISLYKLSQNTGISESTFSKWKSKPTSDISLALAGKIADYFSTPLDYLLTGVESPPKDLAPDQQEILALWDKLDREEQLEFKGELKGYVRAKEKVK